MRRGTGGSRPRSRLLVALLALALVLTAVLAYQAANAERSHRRAASVRCTITRRSQCGSSTSRHRRSC